MLTSQTLSALPGIRHAFFTRQGGVSEGIYQSLNGGVGSRDVPAHIAQNRARMATALGVEPDALLSAYQIHSPDVVVAETSWGPDKRPRADAIVTRVPGLACGISTADCGPVLFADAEARVVGAAHAGWRGALGGVIEATVAAMEKLGADRARIVTAIGPLIRQPHYEVGDEMRATFVNSVAQYERFFVPGTRPAHWQFDLPGFIALQLARADISQIEDLGACTYADADTFYSYRRATHRQEPDYGRHISAIAL
jgi:YfiH family protein